MENQTNGNTDQGKKLNIGYLFLSLGFIITLITSVVSFLNLVFATLDRKFPDVLNSTYQYGYNSYDFESIRVALSTLIIFFPIFLVVGYFWKKIGNKGLGHVDEVIHKLLSYIVMFISSIVVVVDLVVLVRYFVSGEITNRFLLKVLAVLVTAIIVGVYFILELKNYQKKIVKNSLVVASIFLVLFAIIYSFVVMGSPAKQRLLRFDDRRVSDLQNIQSQIINYWQQKEKLPVSLDDLKDPLSYYSLPVPPNFEKGEVYEYKAKDKLSFELCATFALPMPKGWREYSSGGIMPMPARDVAVSSYPYPGPGGVNDSWDHQVGRTCFERKIDPEIYPPFQKQSIKINQ